MQSGWWGEAVSALVAERERLVGNKNDWNRYRNFAELREKLAPEPEKVIHNFLDNGTKKKRKGPSRPEGVVSNLSQSGSQKKPKPKQRKSTPKRPKKAKLTVRKRTRSGPSKSKTDEVLYIEKAIKIYKNTGNSLPLRAKIKELASLEHRLDERLRREKKPSQKLLWQWSYTRERRKRLNAILDTTSDLDPESLSEKSKAERKKLARETLQAGAAAYFEQLKREAGSGSESKKRTEKRYWWNEED